MTLIGILFICRSVLPAINIKLVALWDPLQQSSSAFHFSAPHPPTRGVVPLICLSSLVKIPASNLESLSGYVVLISLLGQRIHFVYMEQTQGYRFLCKRKCTVLLKEIENKYRRPQLRA